MDISPTALAAAEKTAVTLRSIVIVAGVVVMPLLDLFGSGVWLAAALRDAPDPAGDIMIAGLAFSSTIAGILFWLWIEHRTRVATWMRVVVPVITIVNAAMNVGTVSVLLGGPSAADRLVPASPSAAWWLLAVAVVVLGACSEPLWVALLSLARGQSDGVVSSRVMGGLAAPTAEVVAVHVDPDDDDDSDDDDGDGAPVVLYGGAR